MPDNNYVLPAPNIPSFYAQLPQMEQIASPNGFGPRSDILGLISAGLGIARDVYGIKTDSAKLDAMQAEKDRQARLDAGNYNRGEQVQLLQNYDISPTAPGGQPAAATAPTPMLALVQNQNPTGPQMTPLAPNLSTPQAYLAQRNGISSDPAITAQQTPQRQSNSPLLNAVQLFDADTGEPFWVSRKPVVTPPPGEKNFIVLDNVKNPETGEQGTQVIDPATVKGKGGFYPTVPKPVVVKPGAADPKTGLTPYQTINLNDRTATNQDKAIQKAGTELQDFHTIFLNVKDLENTIADGQYTPQGINFTLDKYKKGEEVNVPGVDVPGLGHVGFYSAPARDINAKIDKIFNAELLDRSGKAVTDSEMRRLRAEFNSGKYSTIEDQLSALQAYKNAATGALQNAEAKYNPSVIKDYRKQGGFTSQDLQYVNGEVRQGPDGQNYQYNQLQNRWIQK